MGAPASDLERLLANAGWVRRLALGLAGDAHEAEDLVQDALVVALERGERSEGALAAWFTGVLRNLAWKRRRGDQRRRGREERAARPEAEPATDELEQRVSLHQSLVQAVMRLDEPSRSAVLLRYLEQLPPRAIARKLGVPVNTVRTRIQRGLAHLRRELDRDTGGRERWLPGLLALCEAPGTTVGPLVGVLLMGTKLKGIVAGAALVAGLVVLWRAETAPEPGTEGAGLASAGLDEPAERDTTEPVAERPVPGRVPLEAPSMRLAASAATPARLSVRVVALESGAPLPEIALELVDQAPPREAVTETTDARGRAQFALQPGRALRLATRIHDWTARDEEREIPALVPGETRELELALATEPDTTFFGRVIDGDTRAPLAGAEVRLDDFASWAASAGGRSAPGVLATTSDVDGAFELPLRSWKPGLLRVQHAGHAGALVSVPVAHASAFDPLVVALEAEALLEIVVSGASGTALLARASVGSHHLFQPGPWNYAWRPDPCWEASVEGGGPARIAGLPARVPLVLKIHEGERVLFESEPLRLEPGETRRVEVALTQGGSLAGTVADEAGRPAAGIEIWLVKDVRGEARLLQTFEEPLARARTDTHGAFRLEALSAGSWTVGPAPARALGQPPREELAAGLAQPVTLAPFERREDLTFVIWRGLYVRGRAVGPAGEGVPAASIFGGGADLGGPVLALCDGEGRFALGPLPPGTYVVQGRSSGAGGHTSAAPVLAEAGGAEVELLFAAGCSVSGRVLRPGESARAGFWIVFWRSDGSGFPSSWSALDPLDDSFRREGLEPGTYDLVARTQDGAVGVRGGVELETGREREGVELVLERGAHLSIVCPPRSERDDESDFVRLQLWQGELFLGQGAFALGEAWRELVPAGPLTVKRLDAEGTVLHEQEVVLAAGEEHELVLQR